MFRAYVGRTRRETSSRLQRAADLLLAADTLPCAQIEIHALANKIRNRLAGRSREFAECVNLGCGQLDI